MVSSKLNIFIVDNNKLMDISLKHFLENRFRENLNISLFYDGESCLAKVDKNTNVVILGYFLDGENKNAKNGLEILKAIKKINPKTEVIMFTSNEDVAVAIKAFRAGAADYVIKGENAWERIYSMIKKIITEPIRIMVREFRISKFLLLFLLTFLGMAAIIFWILKTFR